MEIYHFDGAEFRAALSSQELFREEIRDVQMHAEGNLIGVATDQNTHIFSFSNHSLDPLQSLNHSSFKVKFSKDGQHLFVTTEDGQVNIYRNSLFEECSLVFCL